MLLEDFGGLGGFGLLEDELEEGFGVAPCEGRQIPALKSDIETPRDSAFSLRSATDMPAEMAALSSLVLLIIYCLIYIIILPKMLHWVCTFIL